MTTYDVHAHCVPRQFLEFLRVDGPDLGVEVVEEQGGETVVIADRVREGPLPVGLLDIDARLEAMDEGGIDVQLLSHRTGMSAYALRGDAGARYARVFNETLADDIAEHPDRFRGLGAVPLQNPAAAVDELQYLVQELGMVGVEIASTVDGVPLDRAGLEPFWEAAEQLRCLVLLHPYDPLAGIDLSEWFLTNMVGRPAESTVAIGRLMFSGLFDRHPDLVVSLVHGGGFLPYQLGRFHKGYTAVPERTAGDTDRDPLDVARDLYYDSLVHVPEALRFLIDLVGPEQVVIGTDYPYAMHEAEPMTALEAVPEITDEEISLISEENIARIIDDVRH